MAKKRSVSKRLEIIHSEEEFRSLRSRLMFNSLKGIDPALPSLQRGGDRPFYSRRFLAEVAEVGDMEALGPTFDLNDMMQGLDETKTLGDILLYPEVLSRLREEFRQINCLAPECEMNSLSEVLKDNLALVDAKCLTHIFIGRVYLNQGGRESDLESIFWAFREGRQAGLKRFYIDGEIREFPSFDSLLLEKEVASLGSPIFFISIDSSFALDGDQEGIESAIYNSIQERQISSKYAQGFKLYSALLVKVEKSKYEIKNIFPLTGDAWCEKCKLSLVNDEQGMQKQFYLASQCSDLSEKLFENKVLGYEESTLNELTMTKLVNAILVKEETFPISDLWKSVSSSPIGRFLLKTRLSELPLIDRLVLQILVVEATGVTATSFLLELTSVDYALNEKVIRPFLERLVNLGNVIFLGIADSEEMNGLCNLILPKKVISPMVIDVLELRSKIFDLFGNTKEGKLSAFSSQSSLRKKEHSCISCFGFGFVQTKLPFNYLVVRRCEECNGSGCSVRIQSIKAYGLTLADTFSLTVSEFLKHFAVEPQFVPTDLSENAIIYGQRIPINMLLPEMSLNSRINLRNILINRP